MKKTMRRILSVILAILLIVTVSITLTGCGTEARKIAADSEHTEELEVWALIKVNGGEPLHVKVVKWNIPTYGVIRIYTEDRVYLTAPENVLLVADLN